MYPKHDLHTHTNYSDGIAPPVKIVESATEKQLEILAITDHAPEVSVGIDSRKIDQMISDIEFLKKDAEIPVLLGMEANILDLGGSIDFDDSTLEKLDIVSAAIHYLSSASFSSEKIAHSEKVAQDYLESVTNTMKKYDIDFLAHPFWFHEHLSRYLSKEDFEAFAEVVVEQGVAVELNEKYHAPSKELLSICKDKGARFSLGTDAHSPEEVGNTDWGGGMLKKLGIESEKLLMHDFI